VGTVYFAGYSRDITNYRTGFIREHEGSAGSIAHSWTITVLVSIGERFLMKRRFSAMALIVINQRDLYSYGLR
jgi:hypothetical protein